jgi:TRAP-type C4-dicarboxylate transport system permease small subunit
MEMVLIVVTLGGLAYTERTNGHIAVDLFEGPLGRIGRLIDDVLARAIGAGLALLIAWGAWDKMLDAWEWGDATNLLRVPFWPFYALIMISALFYAIVLLADLVRLIGGRSQPESRA